MAAEIEQSFRCFIKSRLGPLLPPVRPPLPPVRLLLPLLRPLPPPLRPLLPPVTLLKRSHHQYMIIANLLEFVQKLKKNWIQLITFQVFTT